MAKFVLYAELIDGQNGMIDAVAYQNKIKKSQLEELIDKYTFYHDDTSVKLQFDTEDGSCRVLLNNEKEQNDYDPHIYTPTEEDIEAEKEWRKQIKEHESHIAESLSAIEKETDKKSAYVKGLLKYIKDERQAIKETEEYLQP